VADMFNTQTQASRINPNEVHDILRNDRRRRTLQYLKQRVEPVTLRDLSERIAEWEANESPAPRGVRQSVYNSLHQTHLPKLDEIGVIEYDTDRKMVELQERARDVDIYMDLVTRFGVTWGTYYRTLGVVSLFAVIVADTNIGMLAQVDSLVFATVFLAVFGVSAAYQLWSRRCFYLRALLGGK
jgi:hypothetical protein